MPQVFQDPKRLVEEFKKSGEFDRLRRQLLTHFANSDEVRPLMARVEEIARDKLTSDPRLEHKTREVVHSEVMQELERYPIVERAVSDLAVLKDEALLTSIEQYVRNIVRGESNDATKLWNAQPSRSKRAEDNDDSSDYSEDDEPGDDELLIITEAERKDAPRTGEPEIGKSTVQIHPPLDETKTSVPGQTPPPSSPPVPASHTLPWPTATHIKPSVSREPSPHDRPDSPGPSSDSFAGELLVNGVRMRDSPMVVDGPGRPHEADREGSSHTSNAIAIPPQEPQPASHNPSTARSPTRSPTRSASLVSSPAQVVSQTL